ncbi:P-loop containing nucleoside triphosphate hydrolase protein [Dimargaris cristalligena]|uniref:Elongation factor 1 alpha-like protein n=1 Tax=Dimargaris cristalligena TaxID=215637 RepID=A0A4P9ZY49_9FUNG|nr:P-loop containing nucleoside triphosphate hydrolase protein [Dimargaris cristalligena]|eukprot:RKP38665.1 P-loop containing nucleoside triphosphate hydrolase protein [Dimargaris cristalligena]
MGHLLYRMGQVSDRVMQKYERDAAKSGKSSFHFAWVLDETEEERSRGVTIDIATSNFETENRQFTILDAPGHRDFIPNMIAGATQADAAILVVDASLGGFEAGFSDYGQTKEHAILARSLGVQQLVVAVNKLDTLDWSEARFLEIRDQVSAFLTQIGFRPETLVFVPCSGLRGTNLTHRVGNEPEKASSKETNAQALVEWYSGPCLVEVIDQLAPPTRTLEGAFRLSVSDFFRGSLLGGTTHNQAASIAATIPVGSAASGGTTGTTVTVSGRVESGSVRVGERLALVPGLEIGTVKAIDHLDNLVQWAAAGDSILMTVQGIDLTQYSVGSVLCPRDHPIPTTSRFEAQIVVFETKVPITQGYPIILHYQSRNEPAFITKLVALLDKSSGEVIKKRPRHLPKSSAAKIEITSDRPVCLDTFQHSKSFGRITLRKGGETIGAGIVTAIF